MSFPLPVVNLAAAVVGTTGTVSWQAIAPQLAAGQQNITPHLLLYNESGCGLQLAFTSGEQPFVPSGGWLSMAISASCTSFTYQVVYVMTGALVNSLIGVWYPPDEQVPATPVAGNSPVGGNIAVTTATSAQLLIGASQSLSVTEVDDSGFPALAPGAGTSLALYLGGRNEVGGYGRTMEVGSSVNPPTAFVNIFGLLTTSQLDLTQTVIVYNNEVTAGAGVPYIVASQLDKSIAVTSLQTIVTYTPIANCLLRITPAVRLANSVSGNSLTCQVSFTDTGGTSRTQFLTFQGSGGAANTIGATGSNSFTNNYWPGNAGLISAKSGAVVTVSYRDPTNTPNDLVSATIERLA